jgi:hypothetical protein
MKGKDKSLRTTVVLQCTALHREHSIAPLFTFSKAVNKAILNILLSDTLKPRPSIQAKSRVPKSY